MKTTWDKSFSAFFFQLTLASLQQAKSPRSEGDPQAFPRMASGGEHLRVRRPSHRDDRA